MADTYAALKAEIIDWAIPDGEPKFDAQVPAFIRLAEARFDRELRVHNMIGMAEIRTTESYIQVPPDWLETIQIAPRDGKPLNSLTIAQQASYQPSDPYVPYGYGQPFGYAMIDGGFRLIPAPDAEATYEVIYYRRVERLADENQTNWILMTAPDLYLHASLAFAFAYLRDEGQVSLFANSAGGVIDRMNEQSKGQEYARGRPLVRIASFG